ncbi:MAG: outer membrane beta-barrel protein [Bradymonadaceae bacterium]
MHKTTLPTLAAALTAFVLLVAGPSSADAALRLGVDGIWIPAASTHVEARDANLDTDHGFGSFGAAAHGYLGPEIFSAGLKLNYFNEGMQVSGAANERRNEFDVNAAVRVGIPKIGLAFYGEAGPSFSTDYDGFGWNAGIGGEYMFNLGPSFQLGPGIEGQYVKLPALINGSSTDHEIGRLMVTLNFDFSV